MRNATNLFSFCFHWLVFRIASSGRMLNLVSCSSWKKEPQRGSRIVFVSELTLTSPSCCSSPRPSFSAQGRPSFLQSLSHFLLPFADPTAPPPLGSSQGHEGEWCCSSFPIGWLFQQNRLKQQLAKLTSPWELWRWKSAHSVPHSTDLFISWSHSLFLTTQAFLNVGLKHWGMQVLQKTHKIWSALETQLQ